jgi:hypothetical protein
MSTGNTDDTHNYSETVGTRLTPQTKRQFEEYRKANELGKTEAARRLIRDELDDTDDTLDTIQKLSIFGAVGYIAMFAVAGIEAAGTLAGAYIAVVLLWSSLPGLRSVVSGDTNR